MRAFVPLLLIPLLTPLLTGCLDPLVADAPAASANLLPAGTAVPYAYDNPELRTKIAENDGIDDRALAAHNYVPLLTGGFSDGAPVSYWSFGPMTRAPSPLYKFFDAPETMKPLQAPLVDALPGDPAYSGVHAIIHVFQGASYDGSLITTPAALADAVELGQVLPPAPTGTFETSPIVVLTPPSAPTGSVPGPDLQVGGTADAPSLAKATPVYGDGVIAGMFELDLPAGVQYGNFILPTMQVSLLRGPDDLMFDAARPIFQAQIQTAPPPPDTKVTLYTPLSTVVNVDLKDEAATSTITSDAQLFDRAAGKVVGANVDRFEVTSTVLLMPLQFTPGAP